MHVIALTHFIPSQYDKTVVKIAIQQGAFQCTSPVREDIVNGRKKSE